VPQVILKVFIIMLYENVFQNPELFPTQASLYPEHSTLGWANINQYFYSNNEYFRLFIRMFILLNKLPILAQKNPKKNQNWVEITKYNVLVYIFTQKCQQITKLDFYRVFIKYFGKMA
jgi:hypothetical protein